MPDPNGFLRHPRETAPTRPVPERIRDYREVHLEMAPAGVEVQARRCMGCGVPFCHHGCPLHNLIPDWNRLVEGSDWRRALDRLHHTNNFPEFTGRLCPAPCEPACVLALGDQPVAIKEVERAIIDRGFAEGWVRPQPAEQRSGRRVAVVGSGPAGLAAAQQLARSGHEVVVFERADRPGGLLRYGIPDYKLPKALLERRLEQLSAEGVEFRCGAGVGAEAGLADLRAEFDAICLANGARRPRELPIPGRELPGVHLAMEYLEGCNRRVGGAVAGPPPPSAAGRRVVILGGGDTGADCLGNALREGCSQVEQLELLAAPPLTRAPGNPWPEWPLVLRLSDAHEEGGVRSFRVQTTRFVESEGRVSGVVVREVEPGPGTAGAAELIPIPGSERTIAAELVLLALGFTGPASADLPEALGLARGPWGRVDAGPDGATAIPGVFACGDVVEGASLVVRAIAGGRRSASSIGSWLARLAV